MERELPSSGRRVLLVDGDKVVASADTLTGLRPFEQIAVSQQGRSRAEIVCLHSSPKRGDNLPALVRNGIHRNHLRSVVGCTGEESETWLDHRPTIVQSTPALCVQARWPNCMIGAPILA